MAQEDIYARLEELGIDRARFARAMEAREDWGGMVHAFEWLTVLGVVLSHWPDAVPEPEPDPLPEEESTIAIPWFTGNTAQPTAPQRPWPWP